MTEQSEPEAFMVEVPVGGNSSSLPANVIFVDGFLLQVLQVLQMLELKIETPTNAQPKVTLKGVYPWDNTQLELVGQGTTLSDCLRDILDQLESYHPAVQTNQQEVSS